MTDPAPTSARDLAKAPGSAWRVLVVEDDVLIRTDIEGTLDDGGFAVVGAPTDLKSAMTFVETRSRLIDCALIDVDLGGHSCRPLVAAMEKLRIPYLLVTAHSEDTVRDMGYTGPVVEKPFTARELSACLSNLVSRKPQEA
ncbi:two-component response regulator [Roseovarius sp. THAF8]|uniref:response regulator n=1 Tax=Roseovarius sp. THAF8 TaxID=2587846 RepID=UPI0012A809E0|nr:response regulator [Roseovarius sp. THAF8]QFT98804.1 two-component response regulator [Roseovarius sp. THAF8]